MNYQTTIPITEARKRIYDIAEDVQKPGCIYTLTENGVPKAVLVSAEQYEAWEETFSVMAEIPTLKQDVREARAEYKLGKTTTLDGWAKKYGIQNRNSKTSPKRTRKTTT
ncbi:MAG: type II toxin-antitoxin system Phd/YefM family antitoxin [Candidatus Doudnabacteria bacterium]|nr:type II toxin-antitoxin system Phd/YefM family antitoxin [Candidatus Doudnabacteria bacterium]